MDSCDSRARFRFHTLNIVSLTDVLTVYARLKIGIFGLVGILGVTTAPFVGRLLDRLVLWVGVFVALIIALLSQVVLTVGGGLSIAAVIITCISKLSVSV